MSDFKVLFSNDLSSAAQIKKYEDKAKATMVKIKNLEDSYKLLTETIHVEFDKSLNLLHGIKSKLGSTETTFNETIERLDKKYNSLLLRATICEKRIKENSWRESKKGRDETKPQGHEQDPKPIFPCKTVVPWPGGDL